MSTAKTKHSFDHVTCPECGDHDVRIFLDLFDIGELRCESCGGTVHIADAIRKAEETLEAWRLIERLVEYAKDLASEA